MEIVSLVNLTEDMVLKSCIYNDKGLNIKNRICYEGLGYKKNIANKFFELYENLRKKGLIVTNKHSCVYDDHLIFEKVYDKDILLNKIIKKIMTLISSFGESIPTVKISNNKIYFNLPKIKQSILTWQNITASYLSELSSEEIEKNENKFNELINELINDRKLEQFNENWYSIVGINNIQDLNIANKKIDSTYRPKKINESEYKDLVYEACKNNTKNGYIIIGKAAVSMGYNKYMSDDTIFMKAFKELIAEGKIISLNKKRYSLSDAVIGCKNYTDNSDNKKESVKQNVKGNITFDTRYNLLKEYILKTYNNYEEFPIFYKSFVGILNKVGKPVHGNSIYIKMLVNEGFLERTNNFRPATYKIVQNNSVPNKIIQPDVAAWNKGIAAETASTVEIKNTSESDNNPGTIFDDINSYIRTIEENHNGLMRKYGSLLNENEILKIEVKNLKESLKDAKAAAEAARNKVYEMSFRH